MHDAAIFPPHALTRDADTPGLLPLTVRGLTYDTDGHRLVDDISLDIEGTGITGIMGPNGAGKSLLIRLLHGLIKPRSGSIVWNGMSQDDRIRARQAMVFQKPVLLRRSVAANVDFVLRLSGKPDPAERDRLLDEAGLRDRARQPARRLSGGEQQRLALVRALATRPDVLFLDEPTASLDPASANMIEEIVQRVSQTGVKVIVVSHDIAQARRLCRDVVFLHRGRLVEHADASRFFDAPSSPEAQAYLAGKLIL